MLKTKSILSPVENSDGYRLSIMSRHTLSDGVTPNPKINDLLYDLHVSVFAPPLKLLGNYYKRNLPWEEFEERYIESLRTDAKKLIVEDFSGLCLFTDFTVLCIEDTPEKCHRRLFAEECQRYESGLEVRIE